MLGWLLGPSKEELADLRKTCKTSIAAYQACLKANAPDTSPCKNLESSTVACLASKKCPRVHKAFEKCIHTTHQEGTQEGRIRRYTEAVPCKKECNAMLKQLRWAGIWPRVVKV